MIAVIYLFCSFLLATAMMMIMGPEATWLQWPYVLVSSAAWLTITIIGYGPVASAIFWEMDRGQREDEILLQERIIDREIRAIEEMGFSHRDAVRIAQLKQNAWWHDGLTTAEQRELAEIQTRQHNQFRRAAE